MNNHFPIRMLNGVGVVATKKRNIRPGKQYNAYFPKPEFGDPVLVRNGENEMTIDRFIPAIVEQYKGDTAKISVVLKQTTLKDTCKAIFDFVYGHIQYELDNPAEEQIRRPARTWADRKGDCDCYTVFISSILYNLRIPHTLRMTSYYPGRGFQHIYVVVPKKSGANMSDKSQYFTIDAVMDNFDQEKPYLQKKDRAMVVPAKGLSGFPIRMLNGDEPIFANRTNLVYDNLYYSPGLNTWALKGLDGGFYIEGDANKRFVEPLNGGEALGFIDTAVKVGSGIFKGVKSLFKGKKKKKAEAAKKADAEKSKGEGMALAQNPAMAPGTLLNSASQGDNTGILASVMKQQTQNLNHSMIMSLNAMDKGQKSMIGQYFSNYGKEVAKMVADGATLKEIAGASKSLALKSLEVTNDLKKEQANLSLKMEDQNKETMKVLESEKMANDQFRNTMQSQSKIMLISMVALGIVVVYIAIKK